MRHFLIGVTGVPCSGKSTFARALKRKVDDSAIIELNHLVKIDKIYSRKDRFGSYVVKIGALGRALQKELERRKEKSIIVTGHLLADIGIRADIVVVLRERLPVLAERMEKRGYQREKIRENLSAEIVDGCAEFTKLGSGETYEAEKADDRRRLIEYIAARSRGKGRRGKFKFKKIVIGSRLGELKAIMKGGNRYGL